MIEGGCEGLEGLTNHFPNLMLHEALTFDPEGYKLCLLFLCTRSTLAVTLELFTTL